VTIEEQCAANQHFPPANDAIVLTVTKNGAFPVPVLRDTVCDVYPDFAEAIRALKPGESFRFEGLAVDYPPPQQQRSERASYNGAADSLKRRRAAFIRKWAPKIALRLTQDSRTGDIAVEQAGRVFDAIERAAPPDED